MRLAAALAVLPLLAAVPAAAQNYNRYDLYGPVVEVSIADLAMGAVAYNNRAVRTKGWLERDMSISSESSVGSRNYRLRDTGGYTVGIIPVPDIADSFETEASDALGQRVEITGLFAESRGANVDRTVGFIEFWKFVVLPDPEQERLAKARKVTIDEIVSRPSRYDGRTVRVVGEFRGHNLFGDLPATSARSRSDWVIHHGDFSVWVTGKKPKGEGWQLDPAMKRDTGKWIEVTGKVQARDKVVYIRAERLLLTAAPPEPLVKAQPTEPPPERPKTPPIVVFALPLDGETEVAEDSRFVVQFSNDMDESTFEGRVQLRYRGEPQAGLRPLSAVSFVYDPGRRALTVDPGDRLGRGTEVELVLLPGIKDIDGLELKPRTGATAEGATDALRYRVGS